MEEQNKDRKTMLIQATNHLPGQCRACLKAIIWTFTKRGARMPMDDGFQIAGYEPVTMPSIGGRALQVTMMRVFCDQSHFATCEFADRFRKQRFA